MTLGIIRCHEAVIMYEKYKLGPANIKESFRVIRPALFEKENVHSIKFSTWNHIFVELF